MIRTWKGKQLVKLLPLKLRCDEHFTHAFTARSFKNDPFDEFGGCFSFFAVYFL